MKRKLDWGILGLLGILGAIWISNFTPGTWLAGWDNLMPELNIWLNLKRSIFTVWQEYQGLGLVGGMGHATDLIRQFILLPLILLLPNNWIRYLWHFSMLGLGTLGFYWGLGLLGKFGKKERFLGALFYLLNFGTIQIFWAPYEAFSTFWGFFPWLIFSFWRVLKKPNKKNWRLFALINILAIPSFYVQTLFLVYLGCLGIWGGLGIISSRKKIKILLKSLATIFLINSFWLLPFFYFLATNLHHPQLGMTNLMSSEETFLRNQHRGTITDFLLLRGYYFDFFDGGKILMQPWQKYFSQTWVLSIGYLLGGLGILGFLKILGKVVKGKGSSFEAGILGMFLLSSTALLSATPPFSWLNYLFRQSLLLNQVFRAPFTKFVYPATFSFSLLFVYGTKTITSILAKIPPKLNLRDYLKTNWIKNFTYSLIFSLIIIYSFPAFEGNFIYPKMRVKIPQEYFQLIDFFKTQPKTARIANLPQGDFWGWTFYRWGLRGSGFLWHGIKQPILDRAFDVWNLNNEQYYWELNYALQKQDTNLLRKIWQKYSVEIVLFDNNITFTEKTYAKQALKTKGLLDKNFPLLAHFGNLWLYRTNVKTQPYLIGRSPQALPPNFELEDQAFAHFGDYTVGSSPTIVFPTQRLFSQRRTEEDLFWVEENSSSWQLNFPFPFSLTDYQFQSNEKLNQLKLPLFPNFSELIADKKPQKIIKIKPEDLINPHHCAPKIKGGKIDFEAGEDEVTLQTKNAALCVDWKDYEFFQKLKKPILAQVEFEYQSQTDEWPRFCFWEIKNKACLNRKDSPFLGFSSHWQKYQEAVVLDPKTQQIANLAFILDGYRQKEKKQIRYRHIELKIYPLPARIKTRKIYPFHWQKEKNNLAITFPKSSSPYFIDNPIKNNLYTLTPEQCNHNLPGKLYQRQIKKENNEKFLRLKSVLADSCLSWYFPQLPLNQGWLLEIKARNKQGYPLLVSSSGREGQYKFFYLKFPSAENWQKYQLIIPPLSSTDLVRGLGISFSNLSFNQNPTINDLASLRLIPLNWEYLQSIWGQKGTVSPSRRQTVESQDNLWFYQVKMEMLLPGETLVLPQSFDRGWVGIYFDGWRPNKLTHLSVNNWANGFQIKKAKGKVQNDKIYLFFWPQALEFLGFLGIIIVLKKIWRG